MKVLVLGTAAVAALNDPAHPRHRQALAFYEANRPVRRGDKNRRTVVPVSVRIAVAWDRTTPVAGPLDRLAIRDVALDHDGADRAAAIRRESGASALDASLGAAITAFPGADITVLTDDPESVANIIGDVPINIQTL